MTQATVPPPASDAAEATPDIANRMFRSPSASHAGITRTLHIVESTTGTLVVRCNCPAGVFPCRRAIPCRHARGVVQLLHDLGAIEQSGTGYRLTCPTERIWADLDRADTEPDETPFSIGYRSGWTDALEDLRQLLETLPDLDVAAALTYTLERAGRGA